MNVRLERNWMMDGYDVWFFERAPQLRILRLEGEVRRWEEASDGADVAPSLRLPHEALEALLAEAEKVIPASHATERHLTDVITTRDRLLKLVEEGWTNA